MHIILTYDSDNYLCRMIRPKLKNFDGLISTELDNMSRININLRLILEHN